MGFTKLFQELVTSTIWQEPNDCRVLWITILALKDREHICRATVPALAKICNITPEQCEEYLQQFQEPDKYSRSQDFEGRRIERVEGGYLVLNAEAYQWKGSIEARKEYIRQKVREHRERKRAGNQAVNSGKQTVTKNKQSKHNKNKNKNQTETKKENVTALGGYGGKSPEPAPPKPGAIPASTKKLDYDFIAKLKTKPAYEGIDIDRELSKAQAWCEVNRRGCTPRFFVNWLNRVEKPIKTRVNKRAAAANDRAESAEMIATWNDLANAMGEPLERLVEKSVAQGRLSKDDAAMILNAP
jgi:hypothetical protein